MRRTGAPIRPCPREVVIDTAAPQMPPHLTNQLLATAMTIAYALDTLAVGQAKAVADGDTAAAENMNRSIEQLRQVREVLINAADTLTPVR